MRVAENTGNSKRLKTKRMGVIRKGMRARGVNKDIIRDKEGKYTIPLRILYKCVVYTYFE